MPILVRAFLIAKVRASETLDTANTKSDISKMPVGLKKRGPASKLNVLAPARAGRAAGPAATREWLGPDEKYPAGPDPLGESMALNYYRE